MMALSFVFSFSLEARLLLGTVPFPLPMLHRLFRIPELPEAPWQAGGLQSATHGLAVEPDTLAAQPSLLPVLLLLFTWLLWFLRKDKGRLGFVWVRWW